MSHTPHGRLVEAIVGMREQAVEQIVDGLLEDRTPPAAIIEMCREAMTIIGKRFELGDAFIPELMMAGVIMKSVSDQVKPYLTDGDSQESLGCVVIGTVKGDIHDVGKGIVASILDAAGFDVVDLGVDVPPAWFADAIRDRGSCMLALSCLLTSGFDAMKATVETIERAGLRSQTRIMVGGAPVTAQVCEYAGADGWGSDAATALNLAKDWADRGTT